MKRTGILAVASSLTLGIFSLTCIAPAYAAEAPINLGTVGTYSVLGGQTVTNTGPSVLGQDLGVSPGTATPGFPPGLVLGSVHKADAVALQAQADLGIAYDDAAGRALTESVAGDLVGRTLVGGVYKSTGPLAVSGTVTLDGQNNPNSVFIFQVASTLDTASASSISLTNGAQACNVYWQIGSAATLGTASTFRGTIMALTSIAVTTGATVEGRALARNGEVTLDNNVFTAPGCETSIPSEPVPTTPVPSEPVPSEPVPTDSNAPVAPTTPATPSAPVVSPPSESPAVDGTTPSDSNVPVPDSASDTGNLSGPGTDRPISSVNGEGTASDTYEGDTTSNTGELADTGVTENLWLAVGIGMLLVIGGILLVAPQKVFRKKH